MAEQAANMLKLSLDALVGMDVDMAYRVRQEGDMVIDRAKHRVTIEGDEIELTLSEFELLSFLAEKKGWVFTRGQLKAEGDLNPL